MNTRLLKVNYPITDESLPIPHLRLLARAMLLDHLDELNVVAVEDVKVTVARHLRTVVASVQTMPRGAGMFHPAPTVSVCPNCHAILSEAAA